MKRTRRMIAAAILACVAGVIVVMVSAQIRSEADVLLNAERLLRESNAPAAQEALARRASMPLGWFRVRVATEHPYMLFLEAVAYTALGKNVEALSRYRAAIERSRTAACAFELGKRHCRALEIEAHFQMANAYVAQGSDDAAVRLLQAGLSMNPDDLNAKKMLEWLLAFKEKQVDALQGQRDRMEKGRGIPLFNIPQPGAGGRQQMHGY